MLNRQLGRWIVDSELGTGAMGKVYLAHAADAPDEVRAVKVLAPDLARDPIARQRFQRETELLCNLDHPNIVRFDGAGVESETLYYVMEYVSGNDCESRLREVGRWPWAEVLDLAIQVTKGLKYAHDHGIVHRDLKPANLLLHMVPTGNQEPTGGSTFQVKIADFGVARAIAHPGEITGSGQFIGTALYMAPEQAAGKPATKRSDFYALGCVLYTLLTGRPPFNGTSLAEMVHKHQFVQPERAGRLLVDLPHDLDELIALLLAKDPAKRPGDGGVLLKRLESIRSKLVRKHNLEDTAFRETGSKPEFDLSVPNPETPLALRHGPSWWLVLRPAVFGIGLLLCVAGIIYAFVRPRPSADELFRKAQPLMASEIPADWERAWNEYLEPLESRFPGHAYKSDVDSFRQMLDQLAAVRRLSVKQRHAGPRSEAQRFFELGVARCQSGDVDGGRLIWDQLVRAFDGVESEQRWVQLALLGLGQVKAQPRALQTQPAVRAALDRARSQADVGERDQAEQIWHGLEDLYRSDPAALELLAEIRRDRERKPPKGKT